MEQNLKIAVEDVLRQAKGEAVKINSFSPLSGGSINEAVKLKTNQGKFFLKWNDADRFPTMFEAEAKGLNLLRKTKEIYIPQVIKAGIVDSTSFLLLEFVEEIPRNQDFWRDFGKSLARLHQHSNTAFGLEHDNYIGSLPQSNQQHRQWTDFFISERLEPQIKMARDGKKINEMHGQRFNKLFQRIEQIFPKELPALLHGDLWNGNYMGSPEGKVCIYDPAVYFGHREMDLAMTKLFGGFEQEFYEGYEEEYPLEHDWDERVPICNLYPLMVHVNLFGDNYLRAVEETIKKF